MSLKFKRIYEAPLPGDGFRILVDRLWPRGISREKASIDLWLKEVAPSTELRKWFNHEPDKWEGFKRRYFMELDDCSELISSILDIAMEKKVTLLFSSRDEKLNNAAALKEYIDKYARSSKAFPFL